MIDGQKDKKRRRGLLNSLFRDYPQIKSFECRVNFNLCQEIDDQGHAIGNFSIVYINDKDVPYSDMGSYSRFDKRLDEGASSLRSLLIELELNEAEAKDLVSRIYSIRLKPHVGQKILIKREDYL